MTFSSQFDGAPTDPHPETQPPSGGQEINISRLPFSFTYAISKSSVIRAACGAVIFDHPYADGSPAR